MRLLIYLLALMSGFSTAEAARADMAQTSSVAQTAVAAAETLIAQEHVAQKRPRSDLLRASDGAAPQLVPPAAIASSPVSRYDLSLQ